MIARENHKGWHLLPAQGVTVSSDGTRFGIVDSRIPKTNQTKDLLFKQSALSMQLDEAWDKRQSWANKQARQTIEGTSDACGVCPRTVLQNRG